MEAPGTYPPIVEALAAARDRAAKSLAAGESGAALTRQLTADIDAFVTRLCCEQLESSTGKLADVAILATGGFGRREFSPYSDLDLIFLFRGEPNEAGQNLAQRILHPLWDARLDAGHAVRSLKQALKLPDSDLTAATALLDARFLAGHEDMAKDFLKSYHQRVARVGPGNLVERLLDEQVTRHSRFGDTIFLLEPDLKSGPGGVRDLCAGRWAAFARFGTGDPEELCHLHQMSERQAEAFAVARDWLLKVRVALHLEAGRLQDQLRFDYQERLAPKLYPGVQRAAGDARSQVAPAVEALMRDFQRHAKTIYRETNRLMLRAAADPKSVLHDKRLSNRGRKAFDESFVIRDRALEVSDPAIFESKPSEMVRIFEVSLDQKAPLGLRTADLIAECAARDPMALRRDPDAAPRFLSVLTDIRDAATPSRLEQMNDLGLLSALMPEWEPITGRVQHDLYHIYTVDQHSLYAVGLLKALARGERAQEYPMAMEEARAAGGRVPLYLATLLHDVGKGVGKNHSEKGAVLGVAIAGRLGLAPHEIAQVEFLIREHLTLGLTSQRRDLEDPELVATVAELCGSEATLRDLFLLNYVDLVCVGPGNLTTWKDELIRELFWRARTCLRRGADRLSVEREETAGQRKDEVTRRLAAHIPEDEAAALMAGLPDRYFIENTTEQIARHLELVRRRTGKSGLEAVPSTRGQGHELVVVADDVPGLLAKVTGVLFANKLDVMEAAIYSREPDGPQGRAEALDVFRVRPATANAILDAERIQKIRAELEAVLGDSVQVEKLVASRAAASSGSLFSRAKPEVPPTEVHIDNDVSSDFTVIDVFAEDKPGVLYSIARILHEQGLDIHRSKVGVEADRVADIFYVRDDRTNAKIVDTGKLEGIRQALLAGLPGSRQRAAS